MSRDYAKKNRPKTAPKKKKSTLNKKRGWHYLVLLIIGGIISYRYFAIDMQKIQQDVYKTVKLTKEKIQEKQQPTFEFYTRLPRGQEKTKQSSSTASTSIGSNTSQTTSNTPYSSSTHRYVIQIASFKQFTDADRLRASLILQGQMATISRFTNNTVTWYRVEIGPFESLQQAKQKQLSLEKLEHSGLIKQIA